ncbi:conserved hypothetical protein [Culex quinquefasciatus]|uniref:Uncharacterized protein n=1 Tax=Culex quinquefasciatus TaxID=7176 RepID=B0WWC3_CULQU|nr:conserved hypothetical protein [Culex quinquefasciatus]|eukprot:XP_001861695.1 conserved hypothetical protein [Culex quinquefasciatus]
MVSDRTTASQRFSPISSAPQSGHTSAENGKRQRRLLRRRNPLPPGTKLNSPAVASFSVRFLLHSGHSRRTDLHLTGGVFGAGSRIADLLQTARTLVLSTLSGFWIGETGETRPGELRNTSRNDRELSLLELVMTTKHCVIYFLLVLPSFLLTVDGGSRLKAHVAEDKLYAEVEGEDESANIASIYRDASGNQFSEAVFKKIFSIIEVD